MGFAFGGLSIQASKKTLQADLISDPVLIDNATTDTKHPYFLILVDEYYSPQKIKKIEKFLKINGVTNYRVVVSVNVNLKKDDIKDGIGKHYRTNQSNWKQYVGNAKAIISAGPALYSINHSTDVLVDHFRDIVFNKSYYWSQDTETYVFPIDSFNDIFVPLAQKTGGMFQPSQASISPDAPANTFRTKFAEYQIGLAQKLRLTKQRRIEPELVKIETTEDFINLCKSYRGAEKMAWDLETSGFDFMINRIGCITMSFDGRTGFYAPWEIVDRVALNELLASVKMQIGANLKFDVRFLWRNGIPAARIDNDTVQLGHVLNEQRSNSLKAHAFLYTQYGGYDRELDRYIEKTGIDDYTAIPEHIMIRYAAMDAIVTWLVHEALQRQLDWVDETYPNEKLPEWTMRRYYEEIMMPAVNTFAEIEYRGVYTDKEKLASSRDYIWNEINRIESELRELWNVDDSFDFNSTKRLGELFERLGWEDLGRSKVDVFQTADAHLSKWAKLGHVGVREFQRLRSLKTILKTFVSAAEDSEKGWAQYLRDHEEDRSTRMHPTFNVMRTESGRCRSDSPNMQNVPSHGEFAKLVKSCITTPDPSEFYLSTVDYASLQIRLAAIDTNLNEDGRDENLYNVYLDPKMGGDMHSRTGYGVFAHGRDFKLEIIEVEDNGVTRAFFADEWVKTTTRGNVQARDLQDTDILLIK
jgi:DNA polymerase I-like protein with 3'-5' exonuclease and polymerase domains